MSYRSSRLPRLKKNQSSADKYSLSIKNIEDFKMRHAEKIKKLKEESSGLLIHSSSHYQSKIENESQIKPTVINLQSKSNYHFMNAIETKSEIPDLSDETLLRRMSFNRRKSSVFNDIYEIKHASARNSNLENKSLGFSKMHLFDVYLDDEIPTKRRDRLPSLVNLYNKANQLRLIEKYNPTTVNSFNQLIKYGMNHDKPKPSYDFKTQSLVLDGVKIKKTNNMYKL